jgi:hypothetical protein
MKTTVTRTKASPSRMTRSRTTMQNIFVVHPIRYGRTMRQSRVFA